MRLMKIYLAQSLAIVFLVLAVATTGQTQDAKRGTVTITGQLVCSVCWSEADRKTTPFGSPEDISCALDCAEKGIASALAVKEGEDYKLYLVDQTQLKDRRPEWLNHFGQQVEVTGRVYAK